MLKRDKSIIFSLMIVVLALAACSPGALSAEPTVLVVEVPQTVVVTQLVTPDTPTAAATQAPASTATPAASPTPDFSPTPLSFPIYYPLENCVASRLHPYDYAYITYGGGANALRSSPDLHASDNIVGYAEEGQEILILAGPECSEGWIVWAVEIVASGAQGWTPESDGNMWFIEPVGSRFWPATTEAPQVTPTFQIPRRGG